jgi:hypothetical protein
MRTLVSSTSLWTVMPSAAMSVSSIAASSSISSPISSCVNGPVTDLNSKSYTIQCNSDTSGGSFSSQTFDGSDYVQCMPACDGTSGCTGWTWTPYVLGGGICPFKPGQLSFTAGSAGYVGGILVGSTSATTTSSTANGQSTTKWCWVE